jgi:ribosomal-protein-serine acetyltransferase
MFVKVLEDNLSLVLLTQIHAEALFKLVDGNREYLEQWMTWPPKTQKIEDAQDFIKACLIGLAENKELACGIEYNGEIVGVITFNKIDHELKKVIIGYWVAKVFQGRGLITKSCHAFIAYAFGTLNMMKIEIHVATQNFPSQRVCERLGFQLEGTIRNSENLHGKILDYNIYGLMKADFS